MNVYERTQQRLKTVFDLFDNIYVSFSGGKDSGVLLNLCIDYVRRRLPGLRAVQGPDLHLDVPAVLAAVGGVEAGRLGTGDA